jgi:hypothetical protein
MIRGFVAAVTGAENNRLAGRFGIGAAGHALSVEFVSAA